MLGFTFRNGVLGDGAEAEVVISSSGSSHFVSQRQVEDKIIKESVTIFRLWILFSFEWRDHHAWLHLGKSKTGNMFFGLKVLNIVRWFSYIGIVLR